ncbi:MAG: NAD(P)(+) transhydrogenase (Re/Si-specific) subunit beta, partial [Ignavibacteriaceae bacterium]|nr:NAD(P)(+) transhydrogenase (Re/Si-specific) subunit beta [Ignavibacteriaceae bacterium]
MEAYKDILVNSVYLIASFLFIFGIKMLSSPTKARKGNIYSAVGMFLAIVVTLLNEHIISYQYIIAGIVIGSAIGSFIAIKVEMTAMPQMVGLLNGFGGGASALVGLTEYLQTLDPSNTRVEVFS